MIRISSSRSLARAGHVLILDLLAPEILGHALAGEDLHSHHRSLDARGGIEGGVLHLARLLAEDGSQELLLGGELGLSLGSHLSHHDVAGPDLGADADDPALVQIRQDRLAHVGNVPGDVLGTQLGVPGLDVQLFDVDGGVDVLLDQLLADQNGVLEVVSPPGHERHQDVSSQRQLPLVGAGSVHQDLTLPDPLPDANQRLLVDARVLVGPGELDQLVDVDAGSPALFSVLAGDPHDDPLGVDAVHDSVAPAEDDGSRIAGGDALHAGSHQRRLGPDQGDRLPLHVGAHQGPVGIVVLQKGDQAGRHADQLLGADVHVLDLFLGNEDEVSLVAGAHPVPDQPAPVVHLHVGLGRDMLVALPGGEIEGVRFVPDHPFPAAAHDLVGLQHVLVRIGFGDLEFRVSRVGDPDVVQDPAVHHLPVGGLDEAELVDTGVATQGGDQPDVGPLRRLHRTDPAVVGGVDVAHLEPRPLPAEAAGAEGGEPPLVGDLRKRVGLIHELGELAAAEELPDGGRHRLGIDQVMGHGRGHLLMHGHLFLDGALHSHQADAELVLQELAHGPDPPVPQVVDVVGGPQVVPQPHQVVDDLAEVAGGKGPLLEGNVLTQLDVQLQPAHPGEVVPSGILEHPLEEGRRRIQRGRVAGPLLPVDLDEGLLLGLDRVFREGIGQDRPHVVRLRKEDRQFLDARLDGPVHGALGDEVVGLQQDLAGLEIDDLRRRHGSLQVVDSDLHLVHAGLQHSRIAGLAELPSGPDEIALRIGRVRDTVARPGPDQRLVQLPEQAAVRSHPDLGDRVEGLQDLLVGLQPQRTQKDGGGKLAFAVDPDVEQVFLGVELELHPRPPVGDDLGQAIFLDPVGFEEDPGRAVQLADDDPLGPVDDEEPVIGHQGDVPEKDLLLLDVPNRPVVGVGVLVPDHQPDGDPERNRIGHPPLLALVQVVLDVELNRIAAVVATLHLVGISGAATAAGNVLDAVRVHHQGIAATDAGAPQILDPLEIPALALPVPDGVVPRTPAMRCL